MAIEDEQARRPSPNWLLRNQFSRQMKNERVDLHPCLAPGGTLFVTSALILHHTAQIVMAEESTPARTRGIEPATNPLTPTEGAPGEPPPVVVDVDAPVGVRNLPLAVLAVIASILLLQYANSVFI